MFLSAASRYFCPKMQRGLEGSSERIDGDVDTEPIWGRGKPQNHLPPYQGLFGLHSVFKF